MRDVVALAGDRVGAVAMSRIPILGETVPLIDTSPPTPINDPLVGAHYHGTRPRYPGEGPGDKITVRLRDLEDAQAWLSGWQDRAILAFYGRKGSAPNTVCLHDLTGPKPRASVDGHIARVWPCEQEPCTLGLGVRD